MTRLLVFTENYGRGGGNRYLIDLVNGVAQEYDSVVVCSNPGGVYDEDLARLAISPETAEVPVLTAPRIWLDLHERNGRKAAILVRLVKALDPLAFAYNAWLGARAIRRFRATAVLSCNGGYPAARSTLSMVVAARLMRRPALLSVASVPYPRKSGVAGRYERLLDRLIWRSASGVILNTATAARVLVEAREAPEERVHVIHNGLDDTSILHAPARSDAPVRVGCVTRFDPEKGVQYLVDAFAALVPTHAGVRLSVVGDGREREGLLQRVRDAGLSGSIEMPGHVPGSIEDVVASFDIYAFPSLYEGLPYSLLEAMRAGCAIVSTNVGGIPEAITDEETGLLVPPADASALAEAVGRLIDDPELRQRLGAAARDRFLGEFSLDAMHRCTNAVFAEAGMLGTSAYAG